MSMVLQRMWIQITSDRKRFGALCLMVAVGLLLWGRIILINNVPRTAVAGEAEQPGPQAEQAKAQTDKPGPAVLIALAKQPVRDPFRISDVHFPQPLPSDSIAPVEPKLIDDQDEDSSVKEARLVQRLKLLAGRYRLDALMPANDMALINGKPYRLNDLLEPLMEANPNGAEPALIPSTTLFRFVEVWPKSVLIESHDHLFELRLEAITQTPQNATPRSGKR